MGCDIHLHIEIKLKGKWEHWGYPNIDRDYRLFTKMAGVRQVQGITPISQPKGLPDDLTVLTQFDANEQTGDRHSESWLSKEEIVRLSDFLEGLTTGGTERFDLEWDILHCYFFGNSFTEMSKYPENIQEEISDLRFIFWFDN